MSCRAEFPGGKREWVNGGKGGEIKKGKERKGVGNGHFLTLTIKMYDLFAPFSYFLHLCRNNLEGERHIENN